MADAYEVGSVPPGNNYSGYSSNGNGDDGHEGERPGKIAVIGAYGSIGKQVYSELNRRGAADRVEGWNRSAPVEQALSDVYNRDTDEANDIHERRRRRKHHKDASSFKIHCPPSKEGFNSEVFARAIEGSDIIVFPLGEIRGFTYKKNEDGSTQLDPETHKPVVARDGNGDPVMASRQEVLKSNWEMLKPMMKVLKESIEKGEVKKDVLVVIGTNPPDPLLTLMQKESGVAADQFMGLGGELDQSRFRRAIRKVMGIHNDQQRETRVVGEHGDNMTPLIRQAEIQVNGEWKKLTDVATPQQVEDIVKETRAGGGWYIKTTAKNDGPDPQPGHSATIAPAAGLVEMVQEAIDVKWKHLAPRPMEASAYLPEEDMFIGHTVTMSPEGKVISGGKPVLTRSEEDGWHKSVKSIRESLATIPGYNEGRENQGKTAAFVR